MRFPKTVKHRKAEATIYGKSKHYPFYRVAYRVDGARRMKSFGRYADAKAWADKQVRELAKGSPVCALSAAQARDALVALQRLEAFRHATDRRVSLLAAVSEYCEALAKLNGHPLGHAVDGFLGTVATVKRRLFSQKNLGVS